jgi:amino acid adenylation domain-containing protein
MTDTTDDAAAADVPDRLADLEAGLARLAAVFDGDVLRVRLAAQLKVASMVTGSPLLGTGRQTWRELVAALGTPQQQADARSAWQAALRQRHVAGERVSQYLLEALQRLASNPDEDHYAATLLSQAEIGALSAMSSGPVKPLPSRRFHELFEVRVAQHPDALAATAGNLRWSYGELNAHANRVARALHEGGLKAGDVVAVIAERGLPWLAAVIAVFKSGGCYLPIEPGLPAGRVRTMLERSGCRRILIQRGLPQPQVGPDAPNAELSYLEDLLAAGRRTADLRLSVAGPQRAYMFFTSGSTGQPKAATCTHEGLLNHLLAKVEDLELTAGYRVAQTAPQGFDISLWQLVAALLVGGSTRIIGQDTVVDADRFLETLARLRIQVVQLVPSYLEVLLSAQEARPRDLEHLRRVSVTGEALKWPLVQRWFAAFPGVPLVNAYGLTETSDDTNHEIMRDPSPHGVVPIGRPIRNTCVFIVDERLALAPTGTIGELVMSGVCLGEGYANDPAHTAATFVADPFRSGSRLYRSGDYGRWLPTGTVEYLGRRDTQLKLHGQRLEIGEIENGLARLAVRDAAVLVAGHPDRPRLVAFYSDATAPGPDQVREALAASLPAYMVPQQLYRLTSLPLNANGKVDRNALRRLAERHMPDRDQYEPPRTGSEQRVARLWADLLEVPLERIGRGSRFTDLGGTSLSAIRVAIGMDRLVTIGELQNAATVAEVAALLDRKVAAVPQARHVGSTRQDRPKT